MEGAEWVHLAEERNMVIHKWLLGSQQIFCAMGRVYLIIPTYIYTKIKKTRSIKAVHKFPPPPTNLLKNTNFLIFFCRTQ